MKLKHSFLVILIGAAAFLASCASSTSLPSSSLATSTPTTIVVSSTPTTSASSELRVFTLEELAQYNGDNGTTAYVAVNGYVYDVSYVSEWEDGWHKGMHLAGTDATAIFADSPHSTAFLNGLTIVGTLAA